MYTYDFMIDFIKLFFRIEGPSILKFPVKENIRRLLSFRLKQLNVFKWQIL